MVYGLKMDYLLNDRKLLKTFVLSWNKFEVEEKVGY